LVIGRIFYLLSISQLIPALQDRWAGRGDRQGGAPAVFAGVIIAVILQIIFSNSEFINNLFGTAPMTLDQWMICLFAGLPMIAVAASVNRIDRPN
jgi:Ca2+-transporting ATPase